MRKPQADELISAVVTYIDKIKEIDDEFTRSVHKIPQDLVNYAYLSRMQILNDRVIVNKSNAANKLSKKVSSIQVRYTIKDIAFVALLLVCFAILLCLFL